MSCVTQRSLNHCLSPKVPFFFKMLLLRLQMVWVRPPPPTFAMITPHLARTMEMGMIRNTRARQSTWAKFCVLAALNWCNYVIRCVIVYVEHMCTCLKRRAWMELHCAVRHVGTLCTLTNLNTLKCSAPDESLHWEKLQTRSPRGRRAPVFALNSQIVRLCPNCCV